MSDYMCKDRNEALLEDIIEISWVFDELEQDTLIDWDQACEKFDGSRGIKQVIERIANEFEDKYPFDTTWEDTDLVYEIEIRKFAKRRLLEEFAGKHTYRVMVVKYGYADIVACDEEEAKKKTNNMWDGEFDWAERDWRNAKIVEQL